MDVKCPHCAELIKADANLCKHCKQPVAAVAVAPAPAPEVTIITEPNGDQIVITKTE